MNLQTRMNHRGTEAQRKAMRRSGQGLPSEDRRANGPGLAPCLLVSVVKVTRFAAVGLAGAALLLGGCRGERSNDRPRQFFPDMDDQARWDPQEQSRFFEDGRTMRHPVEGTVAFARSPLDPAEAGNAEWASTFRIERANFLREDESTYYGGPLNESGGVTQYVETTPMPVTMAMLERGRERFNIYCAACHGYTGDGLGEVGKQWSYALPSFHDPKYVTPDPTSHLWRDGYLFSVSRNGVIDAAGVQKMPGYAHALSIQDTWAVVAYIRALQRSRSGSIEDVPPTSREMLEQQRPAASTGASMSGTGAGLSGTTTIGNASSGGGL